MIFITTESNIEGWEITHHLGIVSSHVVAGTNMFSDIAASWRDVFGGRSESYQKQLESINQEVISNLKRKAQRLGANWITGLHIDHDEISGSGKSMFMVTAYGTSVKAKKTSSGSENTSNLGDKSLDSMQFRDLKTIKNIIKNHQNDI